jgi:hypothetical protein
LLAQGCRCKQTIVVAAAPAADGPAAAIALGTGDVLLLVQSVLIFLVQLAG